VGCQLSCAGAQALRVTQIAAEREDPRRGQGFGRGIGAGQAEDLVARCDQLGDDYGTDSASSARNEHAHGKLPSGDKTFVASP
jgi:hypothetical protein